MKKKNDGQLPLDGIPAHLEKNQQGRPPGMPSLAMIKAETARLGLPDGDAEYVFDRWLESGFKTRLGRIKDWKASIRNLIRNGWLPSLRRVNKFTERDREAEELARIRRAKEDSK
jgi:hypothetical protein